MIGKVWNGIPLTLPFILGMKIYFCVSSWLSWEICTEIKTHYSQPIFPLSNIHINVVCRKRFPRHSTVTIFATAVHLFFLYSPIVHSYVTDWIFNFSLILCTIQAKHARAICWKITAGGDLSFLFFKSINMLWKILLRLKTVDLVHWIVHDEMCKERGFLFLLYFKNKAWVR